MKEELTMLPRTGDIRDVVQFVEDFKSNIEVFTDSEIAALQTELSMYIDTKLNSFGSNVISLF